MTEETLLDCLLSLPPGSWLKIPNEVAHGWLERRGVRLNAAWRLDFSQSLPKNLVIMPGPDCLVAICPHADFGAPHAGFFEADLAHEVPRPIFMTGEGEGAFPQKTSPRTECDSDPG